MNGKAKQKSAGASARYNGQPSIFGIVGACLVGAALALVIFHSM